MSDAGWVAGTYALGLVIFHLGQHFWDSGHRINAALFVFAGVLLIVMASTVAFG